MWDEARTRQVIRLLRGDVLGNVPEERAGPFCVGNRKAFGTGSEWCGVTICSGNACQRLECATSRDRKFA